MLLSLTTFPESAYLAAERRPQASPMEDNAKYTPRPPAPQLSGTEHRGEPAQLPQAPATTAEPHGAQRGASPAAAGSAAATRAPGRWARSCGAFCICLSPRSPSRALLPFAGCRGCSATWVVVDRPGQREGRFRLCRGPARHGCEPPFQVRGMGIRGIYVFSSK